VREVELVHLPNCPAAVSPQASRGLAPAGAVAANQREQREVLPTSGQIDRRRQDDDRVGAPGRWEAAGGHGFHEPAGNGFHLTGVTASGVPLLELTQPDAVRLHGLGSL
jgi:hypothetical protein